MVLETNILRWKQWFERARELDNDRGTRLGTLGFLPVEVRRLIWTHVMETDEMVVLLDKCMNVRDTLLFDAPQSGNDPFDIRSYHKAMGELFEVKDQGPSFALLRASRNIGLEFKDLFLATHTFSFDCAKRLNAFLLNIRNAFGQTPIPALRIRIFLFGCKHRSRLGTYVPHKNADANPDSGRIETSANKPRSCAGKWTEALALLPLNTESVCFEVGGTKEMFKRQLNFVRFLDTHIRSVVPGAKRLLTMMDFPELKVSMYKQYKTSLTMFDKVMIGKMLEEHASNMRLKAWKDRPWWKLLGVETDLDALNRRLRGSYGNHVLTYTKSSLAFVPYRSRVGGHAGEWEEWEYVNTIKGLRHGSMSDLQ
ncbi:MAG: hypothetical protein Q9164_000646 [Protoblastenia rupestris]